MVSGSRLLGFLTGTKPTFSFLSDQHPEEKPRLSTPMTLSFFYLSAMKPGFLAFFCVSSINKE
jgi:hypothetical protein